MRPVIGVTPDVGESTSRPGRPALPVYELKQAYADAVLAAGGLPVVLAYTDDPSAVEEALSLCDGLVITGGAFDIPAELYGAIPGARMGPLKPGRTAFEQRLLRAALAAVLAVEAGGTLYQDIAHEVPSGLDHEQRHDPREPSHAAKIVPGSLLAAIVGASHIEVNSTHHQAVKDPGRAKVSAVALDQVVEAIELPGRFALGVQWHPELIGSHEHLALYRALVDRARR
ncbi:MAG: gamma-glutamyl-gamma-aminobutyrate hydrolase family protein [Deltaproteobacteria bacterium]|nr:MAG: gamma-glutamyl-gamma-aminobutyrate hydrolase family protein [Deltaproteobacteria bacterium]